MTRWPARWAALRLGSRVCAAGLGWVAGLDGAAELGCATGRYAERRAECSLACEPATSGRCFGTPTALALVAQAMTASPVAPMPAVRSHSDGSGKGRTFRGPGQGRAVIGGAPRAAPGRGGLRGEAGLSLHATNR